MASLTAVRIMCSLALTMGLDIMHSDIPQAFIQSMLNSDNSYMSLPRGLSLFGQIWQSPSNCEAQESALWLETVALAVEQSTLQTLCRRSETSFYYKHENGKFLLVLSEVDDLVYTGDKELVQQFEDDLKSKWNISESGKLKSFLGININYDKDAKDPKIEFDVSEKIKKIFGERDWLKGIGCSSLPMHPTPNRKTAASCSTKEDYELIYNKLKDPKTFTSVEVPASTSASHADQISRKP
mmetsp:Transcript_30347/g.93930  ORF Transcript_30347/g.93930 Transcript_30347/m.93930 type:complete len:240 (+) Transcript_30347:2104-2823(+)